MASAELGVSTIPSVHVLAREGEWRLGSPKCSLFETVPVCPVALPMKHRRVHDQL